MLGPSKGGLTDPPFAFAPPDKTTQLEASAVLLLFLKKRLRFWSFPIWLFHLVGLPSCQIEGHFSRPGFPFFFCTRVGDVPRPPPPQIGAVSLDTRSLSFLRRTCSFRRFPLPTSLPLLWVFFASPSCRCCREAENHFPLRKPVFFLVTYFFPFPPDHGVCLHRGPRRGFCTRGSIVVLSHGRRPSSRTLAGLLLYDLLLTVVFGFLFHDFGSPLPSDGRLKEAAPFETFPIGSFSLTAFF